MHAIVREQAPHVTGLMLWIPMLQSDTPAVAAEVAATFPATGLTHFYDAGKLAGDAIARQLGGAGHVAWDVYLVYDQEARRGQTLPPPAAWLHQLGESSWADPARYRWGDSMEADLRAAVRALL